ncbi:MAG: hypothetical protein Q7S89_01480 [bacterium]|nr:hypothetical protein [bacterium]
MKQTPKTLILAPDTNLWKYIATNLSPHLQGANVTMYERPNDAHYGDCGELHAKMLETAIRAASHLVVAVPTADGRDLGMVRKAFGWNKPLCLLVKSCNPAVYEKFGEMHSAHPRFKVVVAVGGPNRVEKFFAREDYVSIPVFTPFDLEHKPWLLMMDVFHKLWN